MALFFSFFFLWRVCQATLTVSWVNCFLVSSSLWQPTHSGTVSSGGTRREERQAAVRDYSLWLYPHLWQEGVVVLLRSKFNSYITEFPHLASSASRQHRLTPPCSLARNYPAGRRIPSLVGVIQLYTHLICPNLSPHLALRLTSPFSTPALPSVLNAVTIPGIPCFFQKPPFLSFFSTNYNQIQPFSWFFISPHPLLSHVLCSLPV